MISKENLKITKNIQIKLFMKEIQKEKICKIKLKKFYKKMKIFKMILKIYQEKFHHYKEKIKC